MKKRFKQILGGIKKRKDGYLTIELTMVFSVLFFSLLLILFIGMVLYQEVRLQSTAIRASERGAMIYGSDVTDMETGRKEIEDFENRNPYRNVPIINGLGDDKYKGIVNDYVEEKMTLGNILEGENINTGNYTTVDHYTLAKRLKVNIQSGYSTPVASIGETFGHSGPFQVSTTISSAVVDSQDFVRNTDLVMDIAKQTAVFGTVEKGFDKIMGYIDKLKDKLK